MKASDLKHSEEQCVVLANYSFASKVFDAKSLDTLILASPKTIIEQSIGRILRLREADRVNTPIVIDVIDTFSIFNNQARTAQSNVLQKVWLQYR